MHRMSTFAGTDKRYYYSTLGSIAIIGDLNSRIGKKQENICRIKTDGNDFDIFQPSSVPRRVSCDSSTNPRGHQLLYLFTNHDLLIANGRVCGDLSGRYTCCQRNGLSVVDLLILPKDLLNRLNYLKVADFDWYSDHSYISADLSVDISKAHDVENSETVSELGSRMQTQIRWWT